MNNPLNDTALLLFSRTASAEASHKKIFKDKKQNANAVQALISRSTLVAKNSQIPLFISTEVEQVGTSFGEKISNAVASVFDKGFKKIIIIGNDCLQITSDILQHTTVELNKKQLVIAPTKKGGISLIGLTKENFIKKEFAEIRWQSEFTFSDLSDSAHRSNCAVSILPFLNDVNTHSDLVHEINFLTIFDKFKSLIQSILSSFYKLGFIQSDCRSYFIYSKNFRGPPSFV